MRCAYGQEGAYYLRLKTLIYSRFVCSLPGSLRAHLELNPMPVIPEIPSDISFMFSIPPESAATRRLAIDFQNFWRDFPFSVIRHLEFTLAFSSTSQTRSTTNYCLEQLGILLLRCRTGIDRILSDPRYRKDVYVARQRGCVGNFIYTEAQALRVLRYCHVRLTTVSALPQKFDELRELWFNAISCCASRLRYIPVGKTPELRIVPELTAARGLIQNLSRSEYDWLVPSIHLVWCLSVCPDDVLRQWGNLRPVDCTE